MTDAKHIDNLLLVRRLREGGDRDDDVAAADLIEYLDMERMKALQWAIEEQSDADTYVQMIYQLKQRLKDEVKAAFEEGFLAGVEDGWTNNPRINKEWKKSKARTSLEK